MKQTLFSVVLVGAALFGTTLFGEHLAAKEVEKKAEVKAAIEAEAAALPSKAELLAISAEDVVYGDANAPVTIFEYASLSCSHCATFYKEILPALDEEYIKTGKVNMVLRNFPHNAPGFRGAMLMACVDRSQYYNFGKVLFSMQDKWAFSSSFLEDLKKIAQVGGVSADAFDGCMADKAVEERVLNVRKVAGEVLDIKATPTFFIGNETLEGGGTVAIFKELLDAELAKAAKAE